MAVEDELDVQLRARCTLIVLVTVEEERALRAVADVAAGRHEPRTPIREISPVLLERLRQSSHQQPAQGRAWISLITALVRHHRRHDIELAETPPAMAAGRDIELDR